MIKYKWDGLSKQVKQHAWLYSQDFSIPIRGDPFTQNAKGSQDTQFNFPNTFEKFTHTTLI